VRVSSPVFFTKEKEEGAFRKHPKVQVIRQELAESSCES